MKKFNTIMLAAACMTVFATTAEAAKKRPTAKQAKQETAQMQVHWHPSARMRRVPMSIFSPTTCSKAAVPESAGRALPNSTSSRRCARRV